MVDLRTEKTEIAGMTNNNWRTEITTERTVIMSAMTKKETELMNGMEKTEIMTWMKITERIKTMIEMTEDWNDYWNYWYDWKDWNEKNDDWKMSNWNNCQKTNISIERTEVTTERTEIMSGMIEKNLK